MGNSENKARWNLGWVKIFCACISAEVNLELPWNACVDGQWELLAGGFCIDWNKAKVLVSGLLPLFSWLCVPSPSGPGARHGTVGRALGVVSGWHSGISPAWGCRRQEGAKPRPWLRIHAVPVLQTLPCRCPQGWLLERWGVTGNTEPAVPLFRTQRSFHGDHFVLAGITAAAGAAGAGLCERGSS